WKNPKAAPGCTYCPTGVEKIANCITHLPWIPLSMVGALRLISKAKTQSEVAVATVYGIALILLFCASSAFHCSSLFPSCPLAPSCANVSGPTASDMSCVWSPPGWAGRGLRTQCMDLFAAAWDNFGLRIKTEKIVVMHQPPPNTTYTAAHINVNGAQLKSVDIFTHLGSNLPRSTKTDDKITHRIATASPAF
ncbi:unnamed protein product, partial [Schistocephalus solidus]|uniref:Envelope glycoprotein E1 n=1 Tax=Schistocephalus solidus TaxID=70667 RepID=A0A183TDU2_SCHSO